MEIKIDRRSKEYQAKADALYVGKRRKVKKRTPDEIMAGSKPHRVKRKTLSTEERKAFVKSRAEEYLNAVKGQGDFRMKTFLIDEVCDHCNYGRRHASIVLRKAAKEHWEASQKAECSLLNH